MLLPSVDLGTTVVERGCNRLATSAIDAPVDNHPLHEGFQPMAIDNDKLMEFVGRFAGDLGATVAAGNVVLGDRLGLYQALATGPATAGVLAERTGTDARYVTEWLRGQAAGGYIEYDADGDSYSMTEEKAFAMTDPNGPLFLPGAFELALGAIAAVPQMEKAFKSGAGFGWHEHDDQVFSGCEKFFRPGYLAHLVAEWIPALDGVQARLEQGAKVADIGCGHGASTILMAQAFPASTFTGSDYHDGSIAEASKRAAEVGVADHISFEVAGAQGFSGTGYDLVTSFDCLHDMGDPVGAAKHVRSALAPEGAWLIVEPAAGDTVAENLNPVGRVYYNFSTLLCVPSALSQPGGYALGAQAGEKAIRQVCTDAGFARFRRIGETPFNLVYEARL
jgi:ubiquinone/menaquinone biosynthesis C-methylase UbiE